MGESAYACPACGGGMELDEKSGNMICPYCDTVMDAEQYRAQRAAEGGAAGAADAKKPFVIFCRSCGAPAGYDIASQSYRCPHCGQTEGVREAQRGFFRWRELKSRSLLAETTANQTRSCPNCGAVTLFPEGEATGRCAFCASALVREEFESSVNFPEMIIPFVLTREEALVQLERWCRENEKTPEAAAVRENLRLLDGWYLPYQMIRGPVDAAIRRDAAQRIYHCSGYLEGSTVCTAGNLDNLVLEAAEPFDWNGLVPFEHGYIAGHKARLQDISDFRTNRRAMEEVGEDYRPYVEKVMQTKGCRIDLSAEQLMSAPVLLPMYLIRTKNLFAVVNGQTGKVAVCIERVKKQYIKLAEPAAITAAALAVSLWLCRAQSELTYRFGLPLLLACVIGAIAFAAKDREIRKMVTRVILTSDGSVARRENRQLVIEQGMDVFRNPFPNIPPFYDVVNGVRTPVEIRFYPPGRVIGIAAKGLAVLLLPYLAAVLIRLIQLGAWAQPLDALRTIRFADGVIWLILAAAIVPALYTRMYRQDVYNHPYIYQLGRDGTKTLIGSAKDRKVTFRGYMRTLWGAEADKKTALVCLIVGIFALISVLMLLTG